MMSQSTYHYSGSQLYVLTQDLSFDNLVTFCYVTKNKAQRYDKNYESSTSTILSLSLVAKWHNDHGTATFPGTVQSLLLLANELGANEQPRSITKPHTHAYTYIYIFSLFFDINYNWQANS